MMNARLRIAKNLLKDDGVLIVAIDENELGTTLLLLDDIFDKLDAQRVEQIVNIVSGDSFGQIFITDTNRENLDKILERTQGCYKIFHVEAGNIHD
jgi:recombinational DNA repair ATPase RecF